MSKTYTVPRRLGEAKINHCIEYTDGQWHGAVTNPQGGEFRKQEDYLLVLLHWMDQTAKELYPHYVPLAAKETQPVEA